MNQTRTAIISFLFGVILAVPAFAEAPAQLGTELEGSVHDEQGQPLVGAVVSVFGKNFAQGARIAVTDDSGQFKVDGVPPGMYRLRAYLSGFLPSAYARVVIEEGVEHVGQVLMSLATLEADTENNNEDAPARTFSEYQWILAHGDRNILKSDDWALPSASVARDRKSETALDSPFGLSGEFGVRAAAYDQGLEEFPGAGAGLDARLAFARLLIPTSATGQWLVSAQVLESALSSWAGRAEYVETGVSGHELTAGVTYGNYLYGDLDDFRPPEAALTSQSGPRSAEWFGSAYAADAFMVGAASLRAGVAFQYFGFLNQGGYATPHLSVAVPLDSRERTIFRSGLDYRVMAPGGEDIGLLSQVAYSDFYGPSLSRRSSVRAERTARFQVELEQQITSSTTLGIKMFQEDAENQLVKIYSKDRIDRIDRIGGAGHFSVGNHGDFRTRGMGVSLSQSFGSMEGSVAYRFGRVDALAPRLEGAPQGSDDEIHDVTTRVATRIDCTHTRLQAAYRLISHPAFAVGQEGFAAGSSLDSRFNIQVFQLLPFVGWNGTSWELMVAVRNLFYEDIENASILDEIAVIDAPRRVLGGVTVRF